MIPSSTPNSQAALWELVSSPSPPLARNPVSHGSAWERVPLSAEETVVPISAVEAVVPRSAVEVVISIFSEITLLPFLVAFPLQTRRPDYSGPRNRLASS